MVVAGGCRCGDWSGVKVFAYLTMLCTDGDKEETQAHAHERSEHTHVDAYRLDGHCGDLVPGGGDSIVELLVTGCCSSRRRGN
jgi:hypothetical protein